MMKKYNRICIVSILSFIILIILMILDIIDLSTLEKNSDMSYYWNIITIDSVLAGFMLATLGMIISMMTSDIVKRLEKASYMDEIYINLFSGVYASLIAIVFSLIMIFIVPINKVQLSIEWISNALNFIMYNIIPFIVLYLLVNTFLYFYISIKDIKFIIENIRKKLIVSTMSDEERKSELKKIKK